MLKPFFFFFLFRVNNYISQQVEYRNKVYLIGIPTKLLEREHSRRMENQDVIFSNDAKVLLCQIMEFKRKREKSECFVAEIPWIKKNRAVFLMKLMMHFFVFHLEEWQLYFENDSVNSATLWQPSDIWHSGTSRTGTRIVFASQSNERLVVVVVLNEREKFIFAVKEKNWNAIQMAAASRGAVQAALQVCERRPTRCKKPRTKTPPTTSVDH